MQLGDIKIENTLTIDFLAVNVEFELTANTVDLVIGKEKEKQKALNKISMNQKAEMNINVGDVIETFDKVEEREQEKIIKSIKEIDFDELQEHFKKFGALENVKRIEFYEHVENKIIDFINGTVTPR